MKSTELAKEFAEWWYGGLDDGEVPPVYEMEGMTEHVKKLLEKYGEIVRAAIVEELRNESKQSAVFTEDAAEIIVLNTYV